MISKKITSLIMAGLLTTMVFTGCDKKSDTSKDNTKTTTSGFDLKSAKVIKPKVLAKLQTGNKISKEDKLTPIWRANTKVEPEIVPISGADAGQYFQMQQVAGTMPEVIAASNGVFDNKGVYTILKKQKSLREITLEDIKKYMPKTIERLKKWDITVDDWYNSNLDPTDKKLWYIPGAPNLGATTEKNEEFVKLANSYEPYCWYFRDDILQKIFPDAKTDKQLKDLYVKNKGKLSYKEVNDVPIKSLDELYTYLNKVKELGMKVGNKNVVPAQLQANSDAGSMMWSAFSLPGFFWQDLGDRMYNSNSFSYFADTPEWKNYISFFNKCYNDKLLGNETFIQKDDQRDAKVINGEYAVAQGWVPIGDARKKAIDENRGYGYRKVALFLNDDLKNKYQDLSKKVTALDSNWGAVGLTTAIKDKDIPQILNWIDWNCSQEANTLRAWGPKEFYTGTGKERKFKSEYAAVADWALYRTSSEKDGINYGMYQLSDNDADFNAETYGVGAWYDEYNPVNVYPENYTDASKINLDTQYDNAVKLHYSSMIKQVKSKPLGEDVIAARAEFDKLEVKFNELKKTVSFDNDGAKTATIKAIIGKPENFDKNYSEYEKKYLTDALKQNIKDMGAKWLDYSKLYNDKYTEPIK